MTCIYYLLYDYHIKIHLIMDCEAFPTLAYYSKVGYLQDGPSDLENPTAHDSLPISMTIFVAETPFMSKSIPS